MTLTSRRAAALAVALASAALFASGCTKTDYSGTGETAIKPATTTATKPASAAQSLPPQSASGTKVKPILSQ